MLRWNLTTTGKIKMAKTWYAIFTVDGGGAHRKVFTQKPSTLELLHSEAELEERYKKSVFAINLFSTEDD